MPKLPLNKRLLLQIKLLVQGVIQKTPRFVKLLKTSIIMYAFVKVLSVRIISIVWSAK
jgi:hypothetical protein